MHIRHALSLGLFMCAGNIATSFQQPVASRIRLLDRVEHSKARRVPTQVFVRADGDFWDQQKELAQEITDGAEKSLKVEQSEKFAARREGLLGDTAFFTSVIFSGCWLFFDNPFFALSYLFGATFGLAYAYGLGKFVETIGGSIDDVGTIQGSGVGQARFAFLIMLFLLVGKLRAFGLIEIPSIAGFFTYQLGSLSQGLREIND